MVINDITRFLMKHNDQELINKFLVYDEIKGYTSNLLPDIGDILNKSYKAAFVENRREVTEKIGLFSCDRLDKKVSFIRNGCLPKKEVLDTIERVTYSSASYRKFMNKWQQDFTKKDLQKVQQIPALTKFKESNIENSSMLVEENSKSRKSKRNLFIPGVQDEEFNVIDKVRFNHREKVVRISTIADNESEDSMGDVDELKYDHLYSKSIVLREKVRLLTNFGMGEKGVLAELMANINSELEEMSLQISY